MTLDPKLFRDYPDLTKGDLVRYKSKGRAGEVVEGVGQVTLIWLGVEEMCQITHFDGTEITICRSIGDDIEKISQ